MIPLSSSELWVVLASELEQIDTLCQQVRTRLVEMNLPSETFPVEILLRESLNNAIIHGNRGDAQKKVRIKVRIGPDTVTLAIEDEGAGFDWRKASTREPDPTAPEGRGLSLYALYAQEITFNEKGNRVTLVRKIKGESHESIRTEA